MVPMMYLLRSIILSFNGINFFSYLPLIQSLIEFHPQKGSQKNWGYIPFVSEQLAIQTFSQYLEYIRGFVTGICHCKHKSNNLTSVVTCQMQLKIMTLAYGFLSISYYAFSYFIGIAPKILVMFELQKGQKRKSNQIIIISLAYKDDLRLLHFVPTSSISDLPVFSALKCRLSNLTYPQFIN